MGLCCTLWLHNSEHLCYIILSSSDVGTFANYVSVLSNTLHSLRNGLGFSLAASQCLIAPPYAVAAIVMFLQAIVGDRWHRRAPIIIVNSLIGIVGLALLGFLKNSKIRYFGVFLATVSCNSNVPAILTYQANNIRGQWKRALSSATLVGAGGLGGIVGTSIFRAQDAPTYVPGMIGCMIAFGLIILVTIFLSIKFLRENRSAELGERVLEGLTGFRYTY
jgi:MFS family permease